MTIAQPFLRQTFQILPAIPKISAKLGWCRGLGGKNRAQKKNAKANKPNSAKNPAARPTGCACPFHSQRHRAGKLGEAGTLTNLGENTGRGVGRGISASDSFSHRGSSHFSAYPGALCAR